MNRMTEAIGQIMVIARDPGAAWVRELCTAAQGRRLATTIYDATDPAVAIVACDRAGPPTRLLVHAQELTGYIATQLERAAPRLGGRVILFAVQGWSEQLAAEAPWRKQFLRALPHAARCIGTQALAAELDRLTTTRGAW